MKTKQLLNRAFLAAALLLSSSALFAQVKIGTNPTVIDAANNLEVEGSTAGRKVAIDKVTGKMTIADGSQGVENILTSDANGVATWKPAGSIRVDETVFVGEQVGNYTVTDWAATFNAVKDRIPLNVRAGSKPGWDPVNKEYTIQEAGYYRVFGGIHFTGALAAPQQTNVVVYLGPWSALNQYSNVSSSVGPLLSVFWQGQLAAGAKVTLWMTNQGVPGSPQNIVTGDSFLTVVKLY